MKRAPAVAEGTAGLELALGALVVAGDPALEGLPVVEDAAVVIAAEVVEIAVEAVEIAAEVAVVVPLQVVVLPMSLPQILLAVSVGQLQFLAANLR